MLTIIDGKNKYEIPTSDQLYFLYNDFIIDMNPLDIDYETVEIIREFHNLIYESIPKKI